MTEAEYISELRGRWPRDISVEATAATLALADEAVQAYPHSATLWDMRGDLIQMGDASTPHTLDDALNSYQRAVEADPSFADAWESIGHFYDVHVDDELAAQKYFDRAAMLRQSRAPRFAITSQTERPATGCCPSR
ncbi:MAG: hypothetical protein QM770_11720 [Tepidisphaeraceae bacterium]